MAKIGQENISVKKSQLASEQGLPPHPKAVTRARALGAIGYVVSLHVNNSRTSLFARRDNPPDNKIEEFED